MCMIFLSTVSGSFLCVGVVSSEELIKYAHRISSSNAVEAPLSWMPGGVLFFVFLLCLWCILAKLNNKIIKIQSKTIKTIKIILNQFVNKSVLKSPDCFSA